MARVLITAFEPYDRWKTNASWLALVQLTHNLPPQPELTTRLYPVDFAAVRERLSVDLDGDYDYALHLGQAPGIGRMHLEAIGLNIGGSGNQSPDQFRPLLEDGPVAVRSQLPLGDWALKLRRVGIPAQVSYHAGTFLCNAALYLSCHTAQIRKLKTMSAFIHVPLDTSQTAGQLQDLAALPAAVTAAGLRLILDELAQAKPNLA